MSLQVTLPTELINFGRSPNLPVDVMLGTVPLPRAGEEKEIPEFIQEINHSLKRVFDDVWQKLKDAHRKTKKDTMRRMQEADSLLETGSGFMSLL